MEAQGTDTHSILIGILFFISYCSLLYTLLKNHSYKLDIKYLQERVEKLDKQYWELKYKN